MIIVMEQGATSEEISEVCNRIENVGLKVHLSQGSERTIIGAIGDERILQAHPINAMRGVEKAVHVLAPYKLVSREFKSNDTVFSVGKCQVGKGSLPIIAGPCSVENRDSFMSTAREVAASGASMLRGGAFKPRTSPYAFQGLGLEGLKILAEARELTGLPVVTEVMDARDIDLVAEYADMLQIGARNMQNFTLLKAVGEIHKPVFLKRGLAASLEEFLMAAEYIASTGSEEIILCERGIRTFETATRNTLDLAAVPWLKRRTHLPVFIDPSHGTGHWNLIRPMVRAGVMAGADGFMVEVHHEPACALSDGTQSLNIKNFKAMMQDVKILKEQYAQLPPV